MNVRITGNFQTMFNAWFDIVSGHDPQHYQDLDWDWEVEIQKFIDDPKGNIQLFASLDAIGKLAEVIRNGTKWNVVENNIKRILEII